jgi:hypothetical protein
MKNESKTETRQTPGESGPLVIMRAEVENYERCGIARFSMARAGVTKLKGRNKAGKSSVGNALRDLLAGAMAPDYDKAMAVLEPVKAGEKSAKVAVTIGNAKDGRPVLSAELRLTRKGRSLYVFPVNEEGKRGIPLGEPANVLARLFGALGVLDPYDFVRMPDKKQVAAFLELVEFPDVTADLDEMEIKLATGQALPDALEYERSRAFTYRTEVNRDLKHLEVARGEIRLPQGWRTMQPVDVNALLDRQGKLQSQRIAHGEALHAAEMAEREQSVTATSVVKAEKALADAQKALKVSQENHKRASAAAAETRKQADARKSPDAEIEQVNTELQQAETVNAVCRQIATAQQQDKQIATTQAQADELTARVEAIEALKRHVLEQAKSPLPGLAYDRERGVIYNDQPLVQASDSEKVLIGAAIAHAQNPRLRWIRVPGSLYESMDDDTAAAFDSQTREWGLQVLAEVVQRNGDSGGLVIVDGVLEADVEEEMPNATGNIE